MRARCKGVALAVALWVGISGAAQAQQVFVGPSGGSSISAGGVTLTVSPPLVCLGCNTLTPTLTLPLNFDGQTTIYNSTGTGPTTGEVAAKGLFIWTNPASTAAGESAGLYVNVASNHVATPGLNDLVPFTVRVSNTAMVNANMWGADLLVQQLNTVTPTGGVYIHGLELELMNGCAGVECSTDPQADASVGSKIRSNGYEAIGHSGSGGRNAGAFTSWANDTTGNLWWSVGLSLARVADTGVQFRKLAGDGIDPFTTALLDASTLAVADQPLLKARSSGVAVYRVRNDVDFGLGLNVSSGDGSPAQTASFGLDDHGVTQWALIKTSGNAFDIWEGDPFVSGNSRLYMDTFENELYGHFRLRGEGATPAAPALSSGCGTNPAIVGSDGAGLITIGTSTLGTCTVTFNQQWSARPVCLLENEDAANLMRAVSVGVASFAISGTFTNGHHIAYLCIGGAA